jgi:hypothetical protein
MASYQNMSMVQRVALQMRGEGKAYKRPPQKRPKIDPQKASQYSAGQLQDAAHQADEGGTRPDQPVQVFSMRCWTL